MVSLVTKSGVTNEKVASFLDKLETLSTSYAKVRKCLLLTYHNTGAKILYNAV